MKRLYEQAFWFYTVIVGFALTQALTGALPSIFPSLAATSQAPLDHKTRWLLGVQLALFLIVICRFYLGGVVFFARAYPMENETAKKHLNRSFELDFISGFIHFVFFFVWSLTISSIQPIAGPLSSYLLLMTFVLGWGIVWLGLSKIIDECQHRKIQSKDPDQKMIPIWARRNIRTLFWCAVLYMPLFYRGHRFLAEYWALTVVAIVSLRDFYEMTSGRPPQLWSQKHPRLKYLYLP